MEDLLAIRQEDVDAVNACLKEDETIKAMLKIVEKYGGVEEINRKGRECRSLEQIMSRLEKEKSPYLDDLNWLIAERDKGSFVTVEAYRKRILGDAYATATFNEENAVTLEISALNNFKWFIVQAKQAIEKQELMPSRYILVRPMKEQEEMGELLPLVAGCLIVGASFVETLDTKGTVPEAPDGGPINVHLGGPPTILGYFGGVGQPNEFALRWVDEFLHYYTEFGVRQMLNVNSGTVLLGYMLHKIGIDLEFKISVFLGNDNPAGCLWTLLAAKLFSRVDGTTSLIGFNLANSVNAETIESASISRRKLGFERNIRLEHHITESYTGIVRQPYDRVEELVEVSKHVPNISAKHEGGMPDIEKTRDHPSNMVEYFASKEDRAKMDDLLLINYLDKHHAVNFTAEALTKAGGAFVAATLLHK